MTSLDPIWIKAHQHISVLDFLWGMKIECGKLKRDRVLLVGKYHWLFIGWAKWVGLIEDIKTGNYHRRWVDVVLQTHGIEHIKSIHSADKKFAVERTGKIGIRVKFVALQPITLVIDAKRFKSRVKLCQPVIGGQPQIPPGSSKMPRIVALRKPSFSVYTRNWRVCGL